MNLQGKRFWKHTHLPITPLLFLGLGTKPVPLWHELGPLHAPSPIRALSLTESDTRPNTTLLTLPGSPYLCLASDLSSTSHVKTEGMEGTGGPLTTPWPQTHLLSCSSTRPSAVESLSDSGLLTLR